MLAADTLLAAPQGAGAGRSLLRLRLARDELSTKILKASRAEEASGRAGIELAEAFDRLCQELKTIRRESPGDAAPDRHPQGRHR